MNNLKKRDDHTLSWVLGILMLVLSIFVAFHFYSLSSSSHKIFSKRVQKAVFQEDDKLQQAKVDLLYSFDQWNHNGAFQAAGYPQVASVGVYVFNKDSLVYWNNNDVEPKLLRKRVELNTDTIVNLHVGDFLVTSTTYHNYSFYLFSLLNSTYPIENKYFVNRFQPVLGNHHIRFGLNADDGEEMFSVYSRSGKLLSFYSIDFPTTWGSSNLPFLIACVALWLLCATLLLIRLATARHSLDWKQPKSRKKPFWPALVFVVMFVYVWVVFGRLFRYGFTQGFFVPSAMRFDYSFLALFVGAIVLVALAFLLRWLLKPWFRGRNEQLLMVGQLVFWGVLLTIVYDRESTRFENLQIQETAQMLSVERDPAFEQSYQKFMTESQTDSVFSSMMHNKDVMAEVVMDYMRNFLFDSVMNQYGVVVTLSSPEQEFALQPFLEANHGANLGKGLYYIDDNTLDPSYLAVLDSVSADSSYPRPVYLEFSKPVIPQGFGLPKLIYDDQGNLLMKSSVACYRDSLLIYKIGPYVYPNYLSDFKHPVNEISYGRKLKHYVYQAADGKVLAISYERRGWMERTTPFVVFFVPLLLLYLLFFFVGDVRRGKVSPATLSRRFQMVVMMALGVSFLIVGPVSVIYLRSLYAQKINETHFDHTRTLSLDITSEVDFSFLKEPGFKTSLDEILRRYSETFFTDINVYSVNGMLLSTTSPELTELQLQSSLMNAEAFHNMQGDRSLYFLNEETLGNAVYQSAYISIQDSTGKALAYLNIPYFTSQPDLRSETVQYVLTYINIVLLIILIFLPIVLIITRRVTDPLVQLQERMQSIDINKPNEQLEWKRNDEIGDLINQYNQLVVELEKSAAELRRTAAESAWRGVARQVAHEIKNSLTPMRLSVQLLQRSAENQDGAMDQRIQRTTATLLEQIDALSDIASSFSQYAKLPVNNPQPLDLAELVGNLVNLYDNVDNIAFNYDYDPGVDHTFNGDKTNLNSAIGNIIKNAVQAIGLKLDGKIDVKLKSTETSYVISVKDNGKGIKEEDKKMIFLPNFTTKNGGSGVGLSLAYNIIHSANGTITFESQEGVGTEFVITLTK